MCNKITITEKRKFIEQTGDWYNIHTADYWLRKDVEYSNPDWGGISTKELYEILTYEELPTVYKENKYNIK